MSSTLTYSTTASSGITLYRITSLAFKSGVPSTHSRVVNGLGALRSRTGARYNYPGVRTVYLTEDLITCLAEKMFYFHREVLRGLDLSHHLGVIPPFQQTFVLWEVVLKSKVSNVADLHSLPQFTYFNIFPSLPLNPSQDYEHLKDRRAHIQSLSYDGLRVGSSRNISHGKLVVLFDDQSSNVASITPHDIDFRLIADPGTPPHDFVNQTTQILDFTAGEVSSPTLALPGVAHSGWYRVQFNH